ncbi:MAG: ATP-dependent DNA helicase RecG [Burkholderiaceae bacterium]|nr:ATP-dependent DNA helicase RecG [Burkholderiaceae bacterium]
MASSSLARFARLGIRREQDLVLHLPLRYEDETTITAIAAARPGATVQIEGEVVRSEVLTRARRSLVVELRDDRAAVTLRFLHFYGSQLRQFTPGARIRAVGEVRGGLFGLEIIHPRYKVVRPGMPLPQTLTPVYPTVAGVAQAALRSAVRSALAAVDLSETVAPELIAAQGLPALADALAVLHAPPPSSDQFALAERTHPAWRRVIFDELLAQQLSLRRARSARGQLAAPKLAVNTMVTALLAALPFKLTAAQRRVWAQIGADLARTQPMNRLLQGDVGSGKTVVATLAAARAIGSGYQVALMAPTEILAEQHWRKLSPWLEAVGVRIAWLTGSLKESEKKAVRARVAAGEVDLLVGTHALIEQSVEFARLGLTVVDEQHRFGVAQRLKLRAKTGANALPHQLMMSATPIPRTLAMSYYADLDVSLIDELPPGRKPVLTKLIAAARRDEVLAAVRSALAQGRQCYWVCPLVEESEALDLQTAIATHAWLVEELAPAQVALVHGRLTGAEKQEVMARFVSGAVAVLVATTVIEVGVDVPNASLMVIEDAERFGLSQLHQLRGRIGRGTRESVCVLLFGSELGSIARERLRVIYESADGFEIARRDLALRGPGEFLGARQSGLPMLRFADLERDADLVDAASAAAVVMLRDHPGLADLHLERWLGAREEFLGA